MDRLSSSMVCILVEDKNSISSQCRYDCSESADPEPGGFIVINTLCVNGALWENIGDDAHITSGNAVVVVGSLPTRDPGSRLGCAQSSSSSPFLDVIATLTLMHSCSCG